MQNSSASNKRIAKNTIVLYIRMLFLMIISLYTSRVILNSLGIEEYGIYDVVGGFVAMFSMISTSLAGAISRYLTFSLAKDTPERLREVFSTSIVIQALLCIVLLIVAESVGIWFVNTQMVIPADRIIAANWVFQLSVLTTMIQLISIPYNSIIIAHERMSAFAYIGIYEGIAKLLIAFAIPYASTDSLILYAILMCLLSVSVRVLYGRYCSKHFPESKFKIVIDKKLIKSMFGFAGWNFIGASAGVLRSQGINILINIFCGPAVNAARGIAMQVNSAVSGFCSNFTTAVRPQITKLYASEEKEAYENLVIKASKFSFFILMILCIPIIVESEYIINLWLVDVPEYTIEFVCIILLLTMIDSLSSPLVHLLLACGNIRNYQIVTGGILLLNFPLAYILLKLGYSPISTVFSTIIISIICLITRLVFLKTLLRFPIKSFLIKVVIRSFIVFILCFLFIIPIKYFISSDNFAMFTINLILTGIICIAISYIFGFTKSEKRFILKPIKKILKR